MKTLYSLFKFYSKITIFSFIFSAGVAIYAINTSENANFSVALTIFMVLFVVLWLLLVSFYQLFYDLFQEWKNLGEELEKADKLNKSR